MGPHSVFVQLLRVPLAWKIAGANALLTLALAAGFYLLPTAMAAPQTRLGLLLLGMLTAMVLNVGLISIALRPIHELSRTAQRVWSGATDVRVAPSAVADRDLRRVARTVDSLLETLQADRAHLKLLTSKLIDARTSERAALARDLTESVAQSATALALECAALKSSNGNGQSREKLDQIGHNAAELVDEVRRIARDVHPRHIDELGLESALRSLTREAAASGSFDVTFTAQGLPATADALPHAVADALYDVARESLHNARRHASARHVEVSLGVERHVARLVVADDGCGFDPTHINPDTGLGLRLMRERLSLLGGTTELLSRPGHGTRIVAIAPLVAAAEVASQHGERNFNRGRNSW